MVIKYNITIYEEAIEKNLDRITNQIFKLLPLREEGSNWQSPLNNLILEIAGMAELLKDKVNLFLLLCKMESLLRLTSDDDFLNYRKIIFECLGIINNIKKCL